MAASRATTALQSAVAACLNARLASSGEGPVEVLGLRSLDGGDINEAHECFVDGYRAESVFVKTNPTASAQLFGCEAHGLSWLASANAVRLPEVLGYSSADRRYSGPHFLVLEMIRPGQRQSGFDEQLGHGLAALHRTAAPAYGLERDNFIGVLPQCNRPVGAGQSARWSDFYVERRLRPQLELAVQGKRAARELQDACAKLFERMHELVGPGDEEPPAYLHGDLWGGNLHVDQDGAPCLIDPAAYAGHREIDLAMMRLFGGFGSRVFDAYHEVYPLAAGEASRTDLYQIYPLFVHLNLFGGHYADSVLRAIRKYL